MSAVSAARDGKKRPKEPGLGNAVRDQWGALLTAVASVLIGALGVTNGLDWRQRVGQVTLTAMAFAVLGLGQTLFGTKTASYWKWTFEQTDSQLSDALNRLGDLSISRVVTFRMALSVIAADAGLGDTERISFYGLPGHGKCPIVGRYSKTPSLDRVGDSHKAHDQGCIGEALATESLVSYDIHADFRGDRAAWVQEQVAHGMAPPEAQALRMPTRSYAAMRISDASHCVGVVVCESTIKGKLTSQLGMISDALHRHEATLSAFAAEASNHGAYLTGWQKGGF